MRGSTPIIEVWNKNVADQEGLSKAISKIKYDFSDNIEEIKKERRELFLYNKEAEKVALNKITVLE